MVQEGSHPTGVFSEFGAGRLAGFQSEKWTDCGTFLPETDDSYGETLLCLGNTEHKAGSDVAGIAMQAEKVEGGWLLNGTKAYVTNGAISDLALITAVSDPDATRNHRLSMFLVDLSSTGVSRKKLHKRVWIPSDLTRLHFAEVFVPNKNIVGERGKGLQQVLATFTQSRIPISGLTLGTAVGAFEAGLERAKKREIFGQKIADF